MKRTVKEKIVDVMHTLSCIRDGKVNDVKLSADACWRALDECLKEIG